MKDNPYLPIPKHHEVFLRDLPKEERKKLVLDGDTTAGPLTVFMYKHPILFYMGVAFVGLCAVGAWLYGCWTSMMN